MALLGDHALDVVLGGVDVADVRQHTRDRARRGAPTPTACTTLRYALRKKPPLPQRPSTLRVLSTCVEFVADEHLAAGRPDARLLAAVLDASRRVHERAGPRRTGTFGPDRGVGNPHTYVQCGAAA